MTRVCDLKPFSSLKPIHAHPFQVPVHQTASRLCMLSDPPGQQGADGCWSWSVNVLKGNVYRGISKSEVACPKKDSITASNCGRFLPALQIKMPLKLFVLGGFCPTRQDPWQPPPQITKTQTHNVKFIMHNGVNN